MSRNAHPNGDMPVKEPSIQVRMPSSRNGRRFALVSNVLSEMGLKHQAVFPLSRRLFLKGLEAKATASPFCQSRTFGSPNPDILITDQSNPPPARKYIQIRYDFLRYLDKPLSEDVLFLPILFHPNLINRDQYNLAHGISQKKKRPIKILFAGNCDVATYDKPHFQSKYGLRNRIELMRMVEKLGNDKVFFPDTSKEFKTALESGELKHRFVWIDTNKFKIPQDEWLALLGQSEYFFCTPGVHYPYCQNLNEAMACGSVPILQYPGFYNPALTDKKNCRVFDGPESLEKLIHSLLFKSNQSGWEKMSLAAVKYHQNNLSLDYAMERLACFLQAQSQTSLTWVLAGKA